jgi:hypothetical protein
MRIESPYGIWPDIDRNNYPFATFYYHGNAAAYLNTVLPIALACLLRSLFITPAPIMLATFVCLLLLLIAAAFVCASKAGMVVSLVLLILLALIFLILFHGRYQQMTFDLPPYILLLVIVAIGVILIVSIGQQAITQRWNFALQAGNGIMAGRQQTATICYQTIPQAGWFGFGPGTFSTIFPFAARQQQITLDGVWLDAHEDYLQTVLEWGKAGATAWGLLFFGSILRALVSQNFCNNLRRYDRLLILGFIFSLLGCAAHALVDYPFQITAIELNLAVAMGLLWSVPTWDPSHVRRRRSSEEERRQKTI